MTVHFEAAAEDAWHRNYDDGVPRSLEPYPDLTLLDYLRQNAASAPNRTALLFKGARISYAELERWSDRFASSLIRFGVESGDRVAIALPNCPQFMIAELGIWKATAIACPINPLYTDRELEDAFNAGGSRIAVVLNRYYARVKGLQSRTSLERIIATGIKDYLPLRLRIGYTLAREKKEGERITVSGGDSRFKPMILRGALSPLPKQSPKPEDPAVILMSGGTTGSPKGVVGSHKGMVTAGLQLRAWLSLRCTSGPTPSWFPCLCSTPTRTPASRAWH